MPMHVAAYCMHSSQPCGHATCNLVLLGIYCKTDDAHQLLLPDSF